MKTFCKLHGCHFENERITAKCPFWKEWGLDKLSFVDKKRIYKWITSLPVDEFALKYNIALSISLSANKLPNKKFINYWEQAVSGYKDWTDKEKRMYQKEYYLKQMAEEEKEITLPWYGYLWEKLKGNI